MGEVTFSPTTVAALRLADRRLRGADRGSDAFRYAVCRNTMGTLTRVDSFYVAFYRGESDMVFPYLFDGDEFQPPDVGTYGPHGLSHWLKVSKQTYRPSQDGGALLARCLPFGDLDEVTRDTIVCPLLDPATGEVAGLMSVGSRVADTYTDEMTAAVEWLGRALMHAIARDSEDLDPLDLYTLYPELDSSRIRDEADLFIQVAARMEELHTAVSDLAAQARSRGEGELSTAAEETRALCERLQVEIADLLRHKKVQDAPDPLSVLTEREAEVALLIAKNHPSNAELAEDLHISEKTVKTHVSNILRKLDISQRSAIGWLLQSGGDQMTSLFDRNPSTTKS